MVEVVLFLGALVPTLVVGIPVALALSRSGGLRPHAARERHVPRARVEVGRAYEPLDLGPDPVHWPSERAWATSGIAVPDWPSASWTDEHFGSGARKAREALQADRGFHMMAVRNHPPSTPPPVRAVEHRQQVVAPVVHARRALAREVQHVVASVVEHVEHHGPPNRAEIEELIAGVGLAGTVQSIMDRTGWDFRQAAQHLARIRSGRES